MVECRRSRFGRASSMSPRSESQLGNSSKEEKLVQLNHMICTAQNLQQTRQLSAIAWWAVMCPSELLTPSMTVIHRHTEKTKGKSGHKYGSPHVQAWAQFVQTMLAAAKKIASQPAKRRSQSLSALKDKDERSPRKVGLISK